MQFFTIQYWQKWFRVAKTANSVATLNPRQIYILPTGWGVIYAIMLIALLVGSINYSVSLGYFITFLLTSLGHTAMLYTWRNLVHLQVTVLHTKPVFAGDLAQVNVQITDDKNRLRHAISAKFEGNNATTDDIQLNQSHTFTLPLQTEKRGYIALPRIALYTEFPLSLLHAWAYVDNPTQILVYAKPADNNILPNLTIDAITNGNSQTSRGDEDFDGHKTYQVGDAASRVDWKASSRGIGLFTKQYSGTGAATLWLNWAETEGMPLETRISQLTKWVIDANKAQQTFGLKLPKLTLAPNNTDAHFHQALSALALL
jgi:uncharacterized protein (DUF58 family)